LWLISCYYLVGLYYLLLIIEQDKWKKRDEDKRHESVYPILKWSKEAIWPCQTQPTTISCWKK